MHDRDGRLGVVKALLAKHGFDQIVSEKEEGFEQTRLCNLFATRSVPA